MIKYCRMCGEIKKEHKIYSVQGELFKCCEKTNCESGYSPEDFVSKEELKKYKERPT